MQFKLSLELITKENQCGPSSSGLSAVYGRVAEHTKQASSIGKHFINEHCIVLKDLCSRFSVLRKRMNKFDCLVHEMLLI